MDRYSETSGRSDNSCHRNPLTLEDQNRIADQRYRMPVSLGILATNAIK